MSFVREYVVYDTIRPFTLENPFVVKVVYKTEKHRFLPDQIQKRNIWKVFSSNGEIIKNYSSLFPYFMNQIDTYNFVFETHLLDDIRSIYRIYNIFDKKNWFINIKIGYKKHRFISRWPTRKRIGCLYGREFNRIIFKLKTNYCDLFNHDHVLNWFLFNPNKFKKDFEQETKIKIEDLNIDFFNRKLTIKLQDSMKIILDTDLFINGLIGRDYVRINAPFQLKSKIINCLTEFSECYKRLNLYLPR